MPLTDAQVAAAAAWYADRVGPPACPACSREGLVINRELLAVPAVTHTVDGILKTDPTRCAAFVVYSCGHCGCARFFDAGAVGLLLRMPQPPQGPAAG